MRIAYDLQNVRQVFKFAGYIFSRLIKTFQSREAVVQRCSVKKVLLEISQNSQENTCARAKGLQLY